MIGTASSANGIIPDRSARERRRSVFDYLQGSAAETDSLEELAAAVVARRSGADRRSRTRVKLRLHRMDLSKPEATGELDYDPRSSTIRCWGPPEGRKSREVLVEEGV